MTDPRLYRLLGVTLLMGILPLFFIDLEQWIGAVPPELHAFAHVGFFGLLAWLLMQLSWLRAYPFPGRAVRVLLLMLVISGMIELIQPLFDRSAGLRDIRQNLVGSVAAITLYAQRGRLRQWLMAIAAGLLLLELNGPGIGLWDRAVARTQFPVLGEFETLFEHRRWSDGVPDTAVARSGARALRVDLQPARYAGTTLLRSFGDWSDHAYLEMSLYNPDDEPLTMILSIRDHEHFRRGGRYEDRFNGEFTIRRGWNDLRFPIAGIREAPAERSLDLSDLSEVVIFTVDLQKPRVIYLDRVRLGTD